LLTREEQRRPSSWHWDILAERRREAADKAEATSDYRRHSGQLIRSRRLS
jgi:hypothetical protein